MSRRLFWGKKILITAGPTREPVNNNFHFSSNHDSRMGFEMAASMLEQGATVFLVSGLANVELQHVRLTTLTVTTACEMYMACCRFFEEVDIAIFAAPVSPFRPKTVGIDLTGFYNEQLNIKMVKNMYIEAALCAVKGCRQVTVSINNSNLPDISGGLATVSAKNLDMLVVSHEVLNYEGGVLPASTIIIKRDGIVVPLSPLMAAGEKINEVMEAIAMCHEQKTSQNRWKNTQHATAVTGNYLY